MLLNQPDLSSTAVRSCIAYSVSKSATGPFSYVDTIVYSGFTQGDNVVPCEVFVLPV